MRRLIAILMACSLAAVMACSDTDVDDGSEDDESTGIDVTVDLQGAHDVASLRYTFSPCAKKDKADILAERELGELDRIDKGKDGHELYQHFFALNAGCYDVRVDPLTARGMPSSMCPTARTSDINVLDGESTEILLVSRCVTDEKDPKDNEKDPKDDEKDPKDYENDEKDPKDDEKDPKDDEKDPKDDEKDPKDDEKDPKDDEKDPKDDDKKYKDYTSPKIKHISYDPGKRLECPDAKVVLCAKVKASKKKSELKFNWKKLWGPELAYGPKVVDRYTEGRITKECVEIGFEDETAKYIFGLKVTETVYDLFKKRTKKRTAKAKIPVKVKCPPVLPPDPPFEEACPRTQGFWRNHLELWPENYTEEPLFDGVTWLEGLVTPPRGDMCYILARQYVAAQLNIAYGAFAPEEVEGAIEDAEDIFENCPGLVEDSALRDEAEAVKDILEAFNEGAHIIDEDECIDIKETELE